MLQGNFAEVFALDVVHDQVLAPGRFNKMVGHAGQVRMGESGENHRFVLKLFLGGRRSIDIFFDSNKPPG